MDIAQLGIRIDTTQTAKAVAALDKLSPAAKRAEMSTGALGAAAARMGTTMPAATTATSGFSAATAAAGNAVALSGHQMQNLQFQINDLAQVLATGQSPFRAIVQQGSQITQIFGPQVGVLGAVRAIGPAISQFFLNPLTLATVGFAVAAQGAWSLVDAVTNGGAKADDALERHRDLIDRIAKAWPEAADAASAYARESEGVAGTLLRGSAQELRDALQAASREFVDTISSAVPSLAGIETGGALTTVVNSELLPFRDAIEDLRASINAGTPDFRGFRDDIASISELNPALGKLAAELLNASDAAFRLEQEIAGANAAISQLGRTVISSPALTMRFADAFGDLTDLRSDLDAFLRDEQRAASRAVRSAERRRSAIDNVVAALAFEEAQLGRTAREQEIYNRLQAAGVDITSKYGMEIAGAAGRVFDMAAALDRAEERQRMVTDAAKDFIGGFASDIISGKNAVDALTDSVGRLAERLLDMALDQAINGLFGNLAGGFGGGIVSAGVGVFHGGYGPGDSIQRRLVHPAHFDDAPRYHDGIGPGERPAIIREDESVLTPGQMRALGRGQGGGFAEVHIHNAPTGTTATQSRRSDGNLRLDVMLRRQIDDTTGALLASGESSTNRELERRYGLAPKL